MDADDAGRRTKHLLPKEEGEQRPVSPPIAYVACHMWPPCAVCARITGTSLERIPSPTPQVRQQTTQTTLPPRPAANSRPKIDLTLPYKSVSTSQYPLPFPPLPPPLFFTPLSMRHSANAANAPTDVPPNLYQQRSGYPTFEQPEVAVLDSHRQLKTGLPVREADGCCAEGLNPDLAKQGPYNQLEKIWDDDQQQTRMWGKYMVPNHVPVDEVYDHLKQRFKLTASGPCRWKGCKRRMKKYRDLRTHVCAIHLGLEG